MGCGGSLSPTMLTAGSGMIPNVSVPGVGTALEVNSTLTSNLSSFDNLGITSQFSNIVTSASGVLSGGVLDNLRTLGADIMPSLTNAIPGDFTSVLNTVAPGGMANGGFSGLIGNMAGGLMGSGDLSLFGQIFNSAQGYQGLANQFINSNLNINNLSTIFGPISGGMDNLITGSFSQVSQAFPALGSDMSNLGSLIDMKNLQNLGDPSALVKQLANVGGIIPGVEAALKTAGLDTISIARLSSASFPGLNDSANKLLYEGMTKITGSDLAQVKNILGVKTQNINTMADLLNPVKIFPTSFPSFTMPTPDGLRGIYATTDGAVNTNLEKFFIDPNAPVYLGNDPINRARLGSLPIGTSTTTFL